MLSTKVNEPTIRAFPAHVPGFSGVPSIVYVLPEPVWPYANIVTLNPWKAASTRLLHVGVVPSSFPSPVRVPQKCWTITMTRATAVGNDKASVPATFGGLRAHRTSSKISA